MSTHRVEVVRIKAIEKHPNADALGIVRIHGYTCCVRLGDFEPGDLAAYVEPDYVVPKDRPEFAFLGEHHRIKVRKMRGVMSQGLLIKAPPGAAEGDDVMAALGIVRYEPPLPISAGGEVEPGPSGIDAPVYNVENWRRYQHVFTPGEPVVVTEKIHGANARFIWAEGRFWCGSRSDWRREDINFWWRGLRASPWLEAYCRAKPGTVVYAEVYGSVQDLRYGHQKGYVSARVFDVRRRGEWLAWNDLAAADLALVPIIAEIPYDPVAIEALADGPSLVPGATHLREGIVIRPLHERRNDEIGRVILKCVSDTYLERA